MYRKLMVTLKGSDIIINLEEGNVIDSVITSRFRHPGFLPQQNINWHTAYQYPRIYNRY